MTSNYDRHQEVSRLQARQKLVNCALLLAYVHGQPGGWYGIASGHIDGFRSDYALIHSSPGDLELHPFRAFYLSGDESELPELDEIRRAVAAYHDESELPPVTKLTPEEIAAARNAVNEALSEEEPEDVEVWLRELCNGGSDISFCNWGAVVAALA